MSQSTALHVPKKARKKPARFFQSPVFVFMGMVFCSPGTPPSPFARQGGRGAVKKNAQKRDKENPSKTTEGGGGETAGENPTFFVL
jgi:hypothetical protein